MPEKSSGVIITAIENKNLCALLDITTSSLIIVINEATYTNPAKRFLIDLGHLFISKTRIGARFPCVLCDHKLK
jgi:hypothetical protein